jgi:hypothetical protein
MTLDAFSRWLGIEVLEAAWGARVFASPFGPTW